MLRKQRVILSKLIHKRARSCCASLNGFAYAHRTVRSLPKSSEYCASKHALHGWAESVGPELRQAGIELLEVHPSTTASEFFTKVLGDPSQQRSLGAMTPEVAATHILRAIRRGRRQAVFPLAGQALVALRRWCPPLFRWVTRPQ